MNISVGVDRILVTENIESIFVTNYNKDTNTVYSLLTGKALQVDFSTYRDMSVYDLENMDNNESIMLVLFTFGSDKSNTGFIVKSFLLSNILQSPQRGKVPILPSGVKII